jgi:hypothetical protein
MAADLVFTLKKVLRSSIAFSVVASISNVTCVFADIHVSLLLIEADKVPPPLHTRYMRLRLPTVESLPVGFVDRRTFGGDANRAGAERTMALAILKINDFWVSFSGYFPPKPLRLGRACSNKTKF